MQDRSFLAPESEGILAYFEYRKVSLITNLAFTADGQLACLGFIAGEDYACGPCLFDDGVGKP